MGGQLQRPRAFSQSAVHTLDRMEQERELDSAGVFPPRPPAHPQRQSEDVTSDEEHMVICEEGDDDVIGKVHALYTSFSICYLATTQNTFCNGLAKLPSIIVACFAYANATNSFFRKVKTNDLSSIIYCIYFINLTFYTRGSGSVENP